MRIRKRPAAASTQTPQHPAGWANITINGDLQEAHQPRIIAAPAVNKPLINSLHLISAQSNSSHGNHKHPSSLAVTNFRQPLADRLQLQNAASSCADTANPKPAVRRNNPISHFRHSLGLNSEPISPASAPVRVSPAANSETGVNHDDQNNNNCAGTDLLSSRVCSKALRELIIPPNSPTGHHGIKDRLQELAVAELQDLHRKSANPRKRRKTTTLMTSNPKLTSQEEPSINKAPKQIEDIPKPERQVQGIKAHDLYTMDPIPNYAEDMKQSISTSKKIMKLKRRRRKTITNQQRSRFANSEVRTDHSTINHNYIASSSTTVAQCNRQDGRRWRCKNPVAPGYLYCEYHSAKMSKNFRLKLLLQQKQKQKQEQSTLQQKHEQCHTTSRSDNQLDLNVPIRADGSDSSINSTDDPWVNGERRLKRRKQINQQSQLSPVIYKNALNHHQSTIKNTDIDPTARMYNNNSNVNLDQLPGSASSAIKRNPGVIITNSVIKQNPIRSTNSARKQVNPGNSTRGRWRKKCKPHMRKLNEIQDVVAAPAIVNNSDMKRIKSSMESRHRADINENDDLSSETDSAAGELDHSAGISNPDCNLDRIKLDNQLEISKRTSITERPIDRLTDVDSDDDELASWSSGEKCRNSYKIALTSSSNGQLSSSYVISQIQFTAFSKLLKAAARADHQPVINGISHPDEEIKALPPAQMYCNGGSVLSPVRTEEIETLPECVLNSDPCEWRSDLLN